MRNNLYIGIDVGGTKIAAALITPSGKILERAKCSTPVKASPKKILKTIFKTIYALSFKKQNLAGIGMGIPGLVDPKNNILITPNINLSHFPLAAKMRKEFHVPIQLGNDVNLGLLAEKWLGAARKARNVVGIFPGTGIGGAVILENKLFTGSHGAAAELGHMIMDLRGPLCSCGNRGCLEAMASRWAIERDIRQAIKENKRTMITKLMDEKNQPIKSRFLKEALRLKDPLVTHIMLNVSVILGNACVSVRHIFNPDLIILGGGVIEACGSFILPIVNKVMRSDPFFSKFDRCRIVQSELGDDAVVLGAVALVRKKG